MFPSTTGRTQNSSGSSRTNRPVKDVLFILSSHVETVVILFHKKPDSVINIKMGFGEGEDKEPFDNIAKRVVAYKPKERVIYKMIKEYIEAKYGFKVHPHNSQR